MSFEHFILMLSEYAATRAHRGINVSTDTIKCTPTQDIHEYMTICKATATLILCLHNTSLHRWMLLRQLGFMCKTKWREIPGGGGGGLGLQYTWGKQEVLTDLYTEHQRKNNNNSITLNWILNKQGESVLNLSENNVQCLHLRNWSGVVQNDKLLD
jgi:hypothetical protein